MKLASDWRDSEQAGVLAQQDLRKREDEASTAEPYKLPLSWQPIPVPSGSAETYSQNDAGRAKMFVDAYADRIRYVPAWKVWLVWETDRWRVDLNGAVERLAIELSRQRLAEAAQIPGLDEAGASAREQATRSALKLGNRGIISNLLGLARCDSRVILDAAQIDSNPWVVGALNSVVNLRTGEVEAYHRDTFITRSLNVNVDPAADCPRWKQFISEIFDDTNVARFVWKAAGYSLTGLNTEHIFLFLYGIGANGKSTFCQVLQSIFGDYGMRASDSLLRFSANGREPEGAIAEIFGKRLILGSETEEGARMNEKLIKDITGGDTLRGRRLYQHAFSFIPGATLWIYGNHRPEIRGNDDGIWRRVRLVPFTQQFTGPQRDQQLFSKLQAELPGILNWLVEGCRLWRQEGLRPPPAVLEAVRQYRTDEDLLADFLDEHVHTPSTDNTTQAELFECYLSWAQREGIRYTLTKKNLAKKLRERGFAETRGTGGARCWRGVALKK